MDLKPPVPYDPNANSTTNANAAGDSNGGTGSASGPDASLVRAWQKRELQKKMANGEFLAQDPEHEAILKQQHDRLLLEIPRAINLDVMAEAYPIVLSQVQMYSRQLGSKNPITLEALTHLRRLAFVLGRECEYADQGESKAK